MSPISPMLSPLKLTFIKIAIFGEGRVLDARHNDVFINQYLFNKEAFITNNKNRDFTYF